MHVRVSLVWARSKKTYTPMHFILMCEPTFCNGVSICDRTQSAQCETNDEERREKNVYEFMNCLAIRLVLTLHSINQAILLESTDSMLCNLFFSVVCCVHFVAMINYLNRVFVCVIQREHILLIWFCVFTSIEFMCELNRQKPQNEINSQIAFFIEKHNEKNMMWSKRRKSHSRNEIMATFNNFIIFIIISHSFWRAHMGYTRSCRTLVRLACQKCEKWHAEKHE